MINPWFLYSPGVELSTAIKPVSLRGIDPKFLAKVDEDERSK